MPTKKSEEDKNNLPAVQTAENLPADFESEVEGLSGYGYSEDQNDSLVPILSILQDNSGEVKRNHARQIEGAKPGDLIIRSLGLVIDPETTDVVVQPCGFQHVWVEWEGEPGDGVVVNQYPYDERPTEAKEKTDPDDDTRTFWAMPNGNRLAETRYHYVQMLVGDAWIPVVIPMSGTNHTVSRSWTAQLKLLRAPNGQKLPSWFRFYGLKTEFNQKGSQSWYKYKLSDYGWVGDKTLRQSGRDLFESLESNVIQADVASESSAASDEEGDGIPV